MVTFNGELRFRECLHGKCCSTGLLTDAREGGVEQYAEQQHTEQRVHDDDRHEGEHVRAHVAPVLKPVVAVVGVDAPGLVYEHVA